MNKAEINDMIEFKKPGTKEKEKGKVTALRDNSVIVEFGKNEKTGEPLKTVINHKNYKVIK